MQHNERQFEEMVMKEEEKGMMVGEREKDTASMFVLICACTFPSSRAGQSTLVHKDKLLCPLLLYGIAVHVLCMWVQRRPDMHLWLQL